MIGSPIINPVQLRERLVEFYMRSFARAFGHADRSTIERKVVADLELVDASHRWSPPRSTRKKQRQAVAADPVSRARSDIDLKFTKSAASAQKYEPGFLHRNPQLVSEQWGCAVARVARILQGSWGTTLTSATKNAEVPKLAERFLETYAFYMSRGRPAPTKGVDHNHFRGLSDRDAARMFMRKVMDICDASTGVLGSWYVK